MIFSVVGTKKTAVINGVSLFLAGVRRAGFYLFIRKKQDFFHTFSKLIVLFPDSTKVAILNVTMMQFNADSNYQPR